MPQFKYYFAIWLIDAKNIENNIALIPHQFFTVLVLYCQCNFFFLNFIYFSVSLVPTWGACTEVPDTNLTSCFITGKKYRSPVIIPLLGLFNHLSKMASVSLRACQSPSTDGWDTSQLILRLLQRPLL